MRLRYEPVGQIVGRKQTIRLYVNGVPEMDYDGYWSQSRGICTLYPSWRHVGGGVAGIPVRCKSKHEIAAHEMWHDIEI